jgi:hypothetical protein
MGLLYAFWGDENRSWQIEGDEGFSLGDMLQELGMREEKALGEKVHGR